MTQKYYVDDLLRINVEAVMLNLYGLLTIKSWLLQENGDLSHGIRKYGLAQEHKKAHNI
jgi:hypothetical protein